MTYFKRAYNTVRTLGQTVTLRGGIPIQFQPVAHDLGVYPHEGKPISDEMMGLIREAVARGVGAIFEITEAEYLELLKKKEEQPDSLKAPWREEWAPKINLEAALNNASQRAKLFPRESVALLDAGPAAATEAKPGPSEMGLVRPTATRK